MIKRLSQTLAAIFLLASSPAWATFALVQHPNNGACGTGSTCTITLTQAIGTGNLLYVQTTQSGSTARTISSINNGGSWVFPASCQQASSNGSVACGYVLSSTGGSTTALITLSGTVSGGWEAFFVEVSSSTRSVALEPAAAGEATSTCANCASPNLTLSALNHALFAGMWLNGTITACTGWSCDIQNGDAVAWKLNTTSGTGVTWTNASAETDRSTIGFSEANRAPYSPVFLQ